MLERLVVGLIALVACARIAFDAAAIPADAVAPTDTVEVACAPLPCAGATSFMSCDGKCFATCTDLVPRTEAAARCAAWGGTLATIHDANENACLLSLLSSHVWLGFEQSPTAVDLLDG